MNSLSRRRFFGSVAAAAAAVSSPTILTNRAYAAAPSLVPRKLPFPPNDNFGSYEPTISADGNTIYFARFGNNGDKRVKGPTDIFVTHRVRQSGEWPGTAEDWSPAERLPATVNSDSADQEPWITPDGNTLYFMSYRKAPGVGPAGIWVSHKQPDGEWGQAQSVPGGNINTSEYVTHCFMPFDLPGQPSAMCFISIRPRGPGAPNTTDLYTTRYVDGVWQPAQRYADRLLDSIAVKCRLSVVTRDDLTLGVVSVHDFGKFHTLLFVHYDPKSKEWKGPIVEAPFNDWNIDGACPNFQANGERMIWSAGYDHGPDLISGGSDDAGGLYDLFWLPTSELIAYYKARAGIG
jgi:WD40-like Beta Propeller Repeat